MDIIISESQYNRLFESIDENMAVWDDYQNVDNLAKEINDINKRIGNNRNNTITKEFTYNDPKLGEVIIRVYFVKEIPSSQNYEGMSHDNNPDFDIELWIAPYHSLENIESLLMHELTHQNNKIYGKQRIGHYFSGTEPVAYWSKAKPNQQNLVETISKILYYLWSNDEQSAYQAISVYNNFKIIGDTYKRLKKLIDELNKDVENEQLLWDYVHDKLNKNSIRFKRFPSKSKFKSWFIKQSLIRLDNFYQKLKKNWYKYHSEINPDEQALKIASAYQSTNSIKIDRLKRTKEFLLNNVDNIAGALYVNIIGGNKLTKSFFELIEIPIDLKLYSSEILYPAKITLLLSKEGRDESIKNGNIYTHRTKYFYRYKNEKPAIETKRQEDGRNRINVWPTAALEKYMRTCRYNEEYPDTKKLYAILKKLLQTQFKELTIDNRK